MGFRWPIFTDVEQFRQALDTARTVDPHTIGAVQNMTEHDTIEDIEDMVSSYQRPRDVQRIVQGLQTGATLPMPIILKGKRGMWIMAGNTRQAVCQVLGAKCQALLVDVSK
jgi:hypothetical protein